MKEIAENIARKFPENRWRNGYIRGKIRTDPAYNAVYEAVKESGLPLWDGGCGLGLLAFYLRERGWTAPILGTDLSVEKVALGNRIAMENYAGIQLIPGSILHPPEDFYGNISILDVLHYLDRQMQRTFLKKLLGMVPQDGRCLIRFTAKDHSWRYAVTCLEEIFIRGIGWIRGGRICFPTQEEVETPFKQAGWKTRVRPLWGRTPFNSYLLIAENS